MTGLLQRDPNRRLGNAGAEEIKKHPFFARHIDWNRYVSIFALNRQLINLYQSPIKEDPTTLQAFRRIRARRREL